MRCEACGESITDDSKYCNACGMEIGIKLNGGSFLSQTKKKRRFVIALSIILTLSLLASIAVFVSFQEKKSLREEYPLSGAWEAELESNVPVLGAQSAKVDLDVNGTSFSLRVSMQDENSLEVSGGILEGECVPSESYSGTYGSATAYAIHLENASWKFMGQSISPEEVTSVVNGGQARIVVPDSSFHERFGKGSWALEIGGRPVAIFKASESESGDSVVQLGWPDGATTYAGYLNGETVSMTWLGSWASSRSENLVGVKASAEFDIVDLNTDTKVTMEVKYSG